MTDSCQLQEEEQSTLSPTARLFVPHRKRISHSYESNEEGVRELRIYYGLKEISFDEAHLFPFGEELIRQAESFVAGDATGWGPGYRWDEVGPLFEAMLAEDILQLDDGTTPTEDPRGGGLVPSQLPPSECPVHRAWSAAECESITMDLSGRAVEIGYLESIIPMYRIVHPSLDGDGRQVGEANVYPGRLRIDSETEWRACQYSGSRFRDPTPMNITALKAMIKHWKPMMAILLELCAEMKRRLPRSAARWTIGDLHTASTVVLTLPAFQQQKGGGGHPQQPLHPILSSLFRITDGIRMSTHGLLFLSDERTRDPEEPATAAELYNFAERNGLFLAGHGVCAGPKAMIDEFLAIAVDGAGQDRADFPKIAELPVEIRDLMAELPAAIDYSLYGLQIWGLTRATWLAMSRAYKRMREILDLVGATAGTTGPYQAVRERLEVEWAFMDFLRIAVVYEHDVHATVYRDGYEQSWKCLAKPIGPDTYDQAVAAVPETAAHQAGFRRLRDLITAALPAEPGSPSVASAFAEVLTLYIRQEQAVLQIVTAIQQEINALLARPEPARPLTGRDFIIYHGMREDYPTTFTHILDALADVLGIRVELTATTFTVEGAANARAAMAASGGDAKTYAGDQAGER